MTHAHFLQMGGLMLKDNGVNKGALTLDTFQELLREQKIDFPKITEEEILDHSKSDSLSKIIVFIQTIWFIVQFFIRAGQGMQPTEIEWITLAFAFGNIVIYITWWRKPFEVGYPIPIPLRPEACTEVDRVSSESQNCGLLASMAMLNINYSA